jgi:hypothetical protein
LTIFTWRKIQEAIFNIERVNLLIFDEPKN